MNFNQNVALDKVTLFPLFIFIIAAEGMCALIDDAANMNAIRGFKVAKNCKEIATILNHYEEASGQLVNLDKSGLWFSKNLSSNTKVMV